MTFAGLLILALGFSLMTFASIPAISQQIRSLRDFRARQAITQSSTYKWWVLGTIGVGSFMSVISHASVLVVLPTIASHFHANLPAVQWVAIGEALTIAVLLLPMGRLSDIIGRKRVYIVGFGIFVLAAVLAGLATNLSTLIVAKVLQGVGSAGVQATGMAMIISTFPGTERGKALGSHLSVVGAGAIAGPALGGLLVSAFGWRSVFFVNVPVGLISIAAAALILQADSSVRGVPENRQPPFDWLGAVLSGGALLVIMLTLSSGNRLGWTSATVGAAAVVSVVLLATFIWWELRVSSPMLELRLFQRKLVSMGVAAGWVTFLGTSSSRFLMPFYLQRVLEYSPKEIGFIMIPPALSMVVLGPISGRLSDQFGWRKLTMGGLLLSAIAWFVFAFTLTERTPVVLIISMLMLQGAGTGLFYTPNSSSILSAVERSRYGVVSALTQLMRNSANVVSLALTTVVVVVTMGSMGVEPSLDAVSPQIAFAFVAGLHRAFLIMGGLLVLGAILCFLRGERQKEILPASPQVRIGDALPNESND